jgi:hypothetical protein
MAFLYELFWVGMGALPTKLQKNWSKLDKPIFLLISKRTVVKLRKKLQHICLILIQNTP